MSILMVGVSGVRGIYGDGLSDEVAERFAYAFGRLYGGTVVVGRDSRVSGVNLMNAVVSGLRKSGSDVTNLGIASTPTTEMAVITWKAAGGIIITASHNPPEWNGLKFLGPEGIFLTKNEGAEVVKLYEMTGSLQNIIPKDSVSEWSAAAEYHIETILALDCVDIQLIKSRRFNVCIDAVNGAGGPICRTLLARLGCEVCGIYMNPTGLFPHDAEPIPENITEFCSLVREKKADVGFALDPDGDRLSIVDENGKALGEEYSFALAADFFMEKGVRTAVCNLSTSRMVDDIAARYGGTVYRSPVGEIHVIELMKEKGAGIGGEGNGGIIYPGLHYGRDAVLGIALILQYMAEKNMPISIIAGSIPSYVMIKEKCHINRKSTWIEPVRDAFPDASIDTRDGIKFIFPDSWVHVRESNTEPIIRIFVEAKAEEKARTLVEEVFKAVK